jgi:hypothetical protein
MIKWLLLLLLTACSQSPAPTSGGSDEVGALSDDGKPLLDFEVKTHVYPDTKLGQPEPAYTFKLKNSYKNIAIKSVYINSPSFKVLSHNCGSKLGKGKTCNINVQFDPVQLGNLGSSLQIFYDNGKVVHAAMMGIGISPLNFAGVIGFDTVTNSSANLSWLAEPGAAKFNFYDEITPGTLVPLGSTPNTGGLLTSFVVPWLLPDTTYNIIVRAADLYGIEEDNTAKVTFTTTANTAPVIQNTPDTPLDIGIEYTKNHSLSTGQDTDVDLDQVVYTCHYDTAVDGFVDTATNPCTSLVNQDASNASFDTATGVFVWTPPFSIAHNTEYEIRISATDPFGGSDEDFFVYQIKHPIPIVEHDLGADDFTFANDKSIHHEEVLALDFRLNQYGDDTTVTSYSCVFDKVIDAAVAPGSDCTNIGADDFSFNTLTGQFSWDPSRDEYGNYEFKVTATNAAGSGDKIFAVQLRPNFNTDGLVYYWDTNFAALGTGPGTNAPLIGTLKELWQYDDAGVNMFFYNADGTTADGWTGDGNKNGNTATTGPYRVSLDGDDSYLEVDTISNLNTWTSFTVDLWVRYKSFDNNHETTIISNTAVGEKGGFHISHYNNWAKTPIVSLGGEYYYPMEIMKDRPLAYYLFNENWTGTANKTLTSNYGSTGVRATLTGNNNVGGHANNFLTYNTSSFRFHRANQTTVALDDVVADFNMGRTHPMSFEFWFKTNTTNQYQTIISKARPATNKGGYEVGQTFGQVGCKDGGIRFVLFAIANNTDRFDVCMADTYADNLADNNWHHVIVTYSGTMGITGVNFYIDGVQVTDKYVRSNNLVSSTTSAPQSVHIGSRDTQHHFDGYIDDVSIFDYELSSAQALNHWNAKDILGCSLGHVEAQDTWVNYAISYDQTLKKLYTYANGRKICELTAGVGVNPQLNGNLQNLVIGMLKDSIGNTVEKTNPLYNVNGNDDGTCDAAESCTQQDVDFAQLRLYDRVLSAEEMRSNHDATLVFQNNSLPNYDDLVYLGRTDKMYDLYDNTSHNLRAGRYNDLSGFSNHGIWQSNAAFRPILQRPAFMNGRTVLNFDNGDDWFYMKDNINTDGKPMDIYIVWGRDSTIHSGGNGYQRLISNMNATYDSNDYSGTAFYAGGQIWQSGGTSVMSTGPKILNRYYGSVNFGQARIGISHATNGQRYKGYMGDLYLYNMTLSPEEKRRVKNHLSAKFDIPPDIDIGLTGFASADGENTIELDFPPDISQYDEVKLVRIAGTTAPAADCTSDGTVIHTYTAGQFTDTNYVDSGLTVSAAYSYRVCVENAANSIISSTVLENQIAERVCGGTQQGGYCWYQGLPGQSCTTVCAANGGYNPATQTYAGSSGTNANCMAVVNAIGTSYSGGTGTFATAAGCYIWVGGNLTRGTTATSSGYSHGSVIRFCACNE